MWATDGVVPDETALETASEGPFRQGLPLHLNVRLDEPLVPEDRWDVDVVPPEPAAKEPGWWRGPPGVRRRCRSVRARWSWPATTPARRPAAWPRRRAGRCSRSPRSGSRTGEHAIRCYRLLLGGPLAEEIERVVVFGHPTLSRPVSRLLARADVEVWAAKTRPRPAPAVRRGRHVHAGRGRSTGPHRLVRALARRRRTGRPRPRRAARRRARPHAVRRRGGGRANPPAGGAARRRCFQPDPRPRPDGAALPGRRSPQGARQPWPVRHRRRRVDGGRLRRSVAPPTAASPWWAT